MEGNNEVPLDMHTVLKHNPAITAALQKLSSHKVKAIMDVISQHCSPLLVDKLPGQSSAILLAQSLSASDVCSAAIRINHTLQHNDVKPIPVRSLYPSAVA
jgi:spore maturation protein SpmB